MVWIRPDHDSVGNHIVVAADGWVFDYHGYADRERYFSHLMRRARQIWPGWEAHVVPLPRDVLVSEARSRGLDGLRLREPGSFLHDALPRAERYLDRFPGPPSG